MFMPLCGAWGQSVVTGVPAVVTDTTIVRYWKSDISVVYVRDRGNNKSFMLVDEASPTVLKIAVPAAMSVSDFRILNDTVYFGGYVVNAMGNKRGLLALFALQDFYNGAGSYNWAEAQPGIMLDIEPIWCSFYNQIVEVTRLAVYDDVQRGPQIAYIGRNYITDETLIRVGIGWATYYGGVWQTHIIYNKYAEEEYTDIIATENYVVAAARTNTQARLALRIFPKSSFLTWTFSWYYYYPDKYGQGFADLEVDENVMAAALDGDEFAVAYHYVSGTTEGLALKTFGISGSVATLTQGLNAPVAHQAGSVWKMRDVRYSPSLKRLTVLNDFDGGTAGSLSSIVYQFHLPTLATGTYYGRYLTGYRLQALDGYGAAADRFAATGSVLGGGILSLYGESLNSPASCGQPDEIKCSTVTASPYTTFMETNMNLPKTIKGNEPFAVEGIGKSLICNQ